MLLNLLVLLLLALTNADASGNDDDDSAEEPSAGGLNRLLYRRLAEASKPKARPRPKATIYSIPGPQEVLPGRSHDGDYWPVFPFVNQYSGGLDLDPSISRHIGGDLNIAVPSWGIMDIYGRFFNRIGDTTTKFGYMNHPVNMMDLERRDLVELMTDPSAAWNREQQPRLPIAKMAKSYVPMSCKPPLCNPYHMNFGLGVEHDLGFNNGVEGDIDVPIPISKGVAYRMPFSGKVYYHLDNITATYGHNLSPIDPYSSLFDYQDHRDPNLAIPRDRTTGTRRVRRSVAMAPGGSLKSKKNKGPTRPWDLDGIDSNEIEDDAASRSDWASDTGRRGASPWPASGQHGTGSGRPRAAWKSFDIDPMHDARLEDMLLYQAAVQQALLAQRRLAFERSFGNPLNPLDFMYFGSPIPQVRRRRSPVYFV